MEYNNNKEVSFREIVLNHLQKILSLTTHELRNESVSITKGQWTDEVIKEDSRLAYVQSVESLAHVLISYFDEKMTTVYEKEMKTISEFGYRVLEENKKEFKKVEEEVGINNQQSFVVLMKLHSAKRLFVELNKFLGRIKHLKVAIYDEDSEEYEEEEE